MKRNMIIIQASRIVFIHKVVTDLSDRADTGRGHFFIRLVKQKPMCL